MANKIHNPATVAPPVGSYSHAIETPPNARWLTISGQVGVGGGIVIDGELAHLGTTGTRQAGAEAPIDGDTVFRIASMTKSFTAMAVMSLRDAGKLNIVSTPFSNGIQYIGMNVTKPPFDNPKVRQAISMAIERGAVIDAALSGFGTPTEQIFAATFWPSLGELEIPAPDIDGAKALLAEAGFPDGFDTTITGFIINLSNDSFIGLVLIARLMPDYIKY